MTSIKSILAAGAVALGLSATASQAASFVDTSPASDPFSSFEFTFTWTNTPASEEITPFAIAYDFDLSLVSYSGIGAEQTGYYVDQYSGMVPSRLTTQTNACDNAAWTGQPGTCDLITASTADGTVLFSDLSAGTYGFGFYDSATPASGTLTFGVTKVSAVPLPAGGVLLLSALGGFAALRRKRKS